jgi:hypothetical protein
VRTWIFQGNPDEFDIDGYLATRPARVVWLVTRYASEIAAGDRVYLWRNQGKIKAIPGVIAECIVSGEPQLRGEDPEGVHFWREKGPRATSQQVRAELRLVRVASTREVIRRDWCESDPILRELSNLRMQAQTNYPVEDELSLRLGALWSRTGRDWTRNELVAGLLAYADTFGKPVSQLAGSPIANVALTIGRAVSGVYAKVMNFRSLDPRVDGKGMSASGEGDKIVWQDFFDPESANIRLDDLRREYVRLWGDPTSSTPTLALRLDHTARAILDEAAGLEKQTLQALLEKYAKQAPQAKARPGARALSAQAYERNPLVIAIARKRAAYKCEVTGCAHTLFETPKGHTYTEVHHVGPLGEGGEDTIENVACLCPAHHREIHLGAKSAELTAQLVALRQTASNIDHEVLISITAMDAAS